MITVQFCAIVNGKDTNVGKLIWDGKKFAIKSKRRSVKTILGDPITVSRVIGKRRGVETVWAHDDPERFIRSLYLQYHGG